MWEPQIITFLLIDEICYCVFGRDGAVGAGRKLPAPPRVPALTVPHVYVRLQRAGLVLVTTRRAAKSFEKRENRI